jgi:hypothetical protein
MIVVTDVELLTQERDEARLVANILARFIDKCQEEMPEDALMILARSYELPIERKLEMLRKLTEER